MMQEIFKDIEGFEGRYQISNYGRVLSTIFKKSKMLNGRQNSDGYIMIDLRIDKNILKKKKIHRLVAAAFIENPQNKPQVNHINGIKSDNNVSNLEWVSQSENMLHSYCNLNRKSNRKRVVMLDSNLRKIREFKSMTEASISMKVTTAAISFAVIRKTKCKNHYWQIIDSDALKT